jgi:acetylornithine/succinyldiaminopimelate/putrescine aminotransferase
MTTMQIAETAPGPFDAVMEITGRPPIVFTSGQGSWLMDTQGVTSTSFRAGRSTAWVMHRLRSCGRWRNRPSG